MKTFYYIKKDTFLFKFVPPPWTPMCVSLKKIKSALSHGNHYYLINDKIDSRPTDKSNKKVSFLI